MTNRPVKRGECWRIGEKKNEEMKDILWRGDTVKFINALRLR